MTIVQPVRDRMQALIEEFRTRKIKTFEFSDRLWDEVESAEGSKDPGVHSVGMFLLQFFDLVLADVYIEPLSPEADKTFKLISAFLASGLEYRLATPNQTSWFSSKRGPWCELPDHFPFSSWEEAERFTSASA